MDGCDERRLGWDAEVADWKYPLGRWYSPPIGLLETRQLASPWQPALSVERSGQGVLLVTSLVSG
jgi:hypothetical protein